jgi:hypothetical protein
MFRYQTDNHDLISRQDVISCREDEDMTRQEFKDDADINKLVERHGLVVRPVEYGEHNFDEDLTARMQSRSLFEAWYAEAPAEVREMYADMGAFLRAFGSGAFKTPSAGVEPPVGGSTPAEGQQGGVEPPR